MRYRTDDTVGTVGGSEIALANDGDTVRHPGVTRRETLEYLRPFFMKLTLCQVAF